MRDEHEPSDARLLVAAAGGDGDAYAAFYRRHLPAIVGWFLRRTHDRELAADLAAETFAAALLACPRYRPEEGPATAWLFGIAGHKLRDSLRRGRVESSARRRLAMERIALTDDDLERVEQLASQEGPLLEAVADLSQNQRDAIVARVVHELDYAEISAALQVSEAVVRQRVSRGLTGLRARLNGAEG